MYCKNCGNEIPDDSAFCPKCGTKLDGSSDSIKKVSAKSDKKLNPMLIAVPLVLVAVIVGGVFIIRSIQKTNTAKELAIQESIAKEKEEMAYVGFQDIDGKRKYNKGNKTYATSEWVIVGDDWYYAGDDGEIKTSQWIDKIYYVDASGKMLKNTRTPDGFLVDNDGKYVDEVAIAQQQALLAAQKKAQQQAQLQAQLAAQQQTEHATTLTDKETKINISVSTGKTTRESWDETKSFYFVDTKQYTSSVDVGDTTCEVKITYPILGGKDNAEVALVNDYIQEAIANLEENASEYVNRQTKEPRTYNLKKCAITTNTNSSLKISFTGTMSTKGLSDKTIKQVFSYDRRNEDFEVIMS